MIQLDYDLKEYPETDGKPMAESTRQRNAILTISDGLETLFADDPNVFVAGDLFWYPVEGRPKIVTAPDVMVVFGRPKGDRYSYLQWLEEDVPVQIVFEILSPSNRPGEMRKKFAFYEKHGVEEYYIYDPNEGKLKFEGYRRDGNRLDPIADVGRGWISPRLGVRFEFDPETGLEVYAPDGSRFLTPGELREERSETSLLAKRRAEEIKRLKALLRANGIDPGKDI